MSAEAATAGAYIFNSVLGSKSASDSNRSNERIAEQNRDWQDKNYEQSLSAQLGSGNISRDVSYTGEHDKSYSKSILGRFYDEKIAPTQPKPKLLSIYGDKGSDLLGRDRDIEYTGKNIDMMFDKMSARGLTPQEIAGSPVPGGAKVSGGNNVLGNAVNSASSTRSHANTALTSQLINSKTQLATAKIGAQSRIAAEAIKAGVNLKGQQVSASTARYVSELSSKTGKFNTAQTTQATRDAAQIYANASTYSTDIKRQNVLSQLAVTQKLNDQQIAKMSAQIALIKQDTSFKEVIHSERWQKLFSSMSAENVLASVLAVKNGINIQSVLKGTKVEDQQALMNFIHDVSASKSTIRKETIGAAKTGSDTMSELNGLIQRLLISDENLRETVKKVLNYERIE